MNKFAQENGYFLAEKVIPPRGMELLTEFIVDFPAFAISHTRSLPRIVGLAHDLLGPDLCDTNEAVVHYNPTRIYSDWHYDIPWDSLDGGVIPCWRFGIYFQDYTTHSGCLSVAATSHLGPMNETRDVSVVPMRSRPGDVVVWNLRTMHQPNTKIGDLPFATPRNAIIFDYASPGIEVERYKTWRLNRPPKGP